MNFPFFNRLQVKKVVAASGEAGVRAEAMLTALLRELPELLLAYVADNQTGALLASYTASAAYNPNQLNVRTTKQLRTMNEALATGAHRCVGLSGRPTAPPAAGGQWPVALLRGRAPGRCQPGHCQGSDAPGYHLETLNF